MAVAFARRCAAALKVNSSIVNLDLKHNRIGKKGAKAWQWAPRLHAALCHASEDENWRGFHLISHPSWREGVEIGVEYVEGLNNISGSRF